MAELPPAFQFYAGDWLSSQNVMAMTLEEEGAFVRLLAIAWKDPDCGISSDESRLSKLMKGRWSRVREAVLPMFVEHPTAPGKLINPRLYREWERLQKRRETMSAAGKAGAEKKWGSHSRASETPMASDSSSSSSSSSSSLPEGEKSYSPVGELSSSTSEDDQATLEGFDRLSPIREKVTVPPCPHQAIIDLWHRYFPNHPRVRVWDEASKRRLVCRWRERKERQSLEHWERLFRDVVPRSSWLMGRKNGRDGTPYKLKLRWFTYPTNLAELENGEHDDQAPSAAERIAAPKYSRQLNGIEDLMRKYDKPQPGRKEIPDGSDE